MINETTIKINFSGGIISPGDLYNVLVACGKVGISQVRFGLRQQLLISVPLDAKNILTSELSNINIKYQTDGDFYPNIVSSYPAEEIFINNTWLSEGVYKDVFDGIDYQPKLKINISDCNQSFTPLLTGNINWVASKDVLHFWHLFIRFPKTNIIYEWSQMVYSNDVARISKEIEEAIFNNKELFYDNNKAKLNLLMELLYTDKYITKPATKNVELPAFNLPYYEGLNRYNNNKLWMGVYRRDELFSTAFLKELSLLCLETKNGQLCSTPWKSIIIKGIDEKDKEKWSDLLEKHHLNIRHAANELNFQVEDNCCEGLDLKKYLVKNLNNADTRTFGICIGIKTRKKSEVFSSILIKQKPLIRLFGKGFLPVYDILLAEDFNPNKRTGFVFSKNNPRFLLGDQLNRSILSFYQSKLEQNEAALKIIPIKKEIDETVALKHVHQCKHCFTIYDEANGEPEQNIEPGKKFETLPEHFHCPLCESPKSDFVWIDKEQLKLQTV